MNMLKTLHIILIIISFLLLNSAFAAGKFYKWTDEKGQVHFSQQAPPVKLNSSDDNVVQMTGNASSYKIIPFKKGSKMYCGSLELYGGQHFDALLIDDLKLNMSSWLKIQKDAEKNYTTLIEKKSSIKDIKKARVWFNETSCRVSWASKNIVYFSSEKYKNDLKIIKRNQNYNALIENRALECPDNINYQGRSSTWSSRNPDIMVGDEAEEYYQCRQYYKKKLDEFKKYK